MKRRRRRPVEWVPTYTSTPNALDGPGNLAPFLAIGFTGANPVAPALSTWNVLIGDAPQGVASLPTGTSPGPITPYSLMEDRKDYTVRRLVGRLHLELSQWTASGGVGIPFPVMAKWGFAVMDTNNLGSVSADFVNWDPNLQMNGDAPYLMLESTPFGSNQVVGQLVGNVSTTPQNWGETWPANNQWGAVDRTKIDVRVNRKIGQGQKLVFFLTMAPMAPFAMDYHGNNPVLSGFLDVRALISWRGSHSKRR